MALRACLLVALLALLPVQTASAGFRDWWLTPDQQGRLAYQRGEYALAAQRFSDPLWKGLAFYASQDFTSAAAWFATVETAYGYFYLGNALAHLGRLVDAVDAYQQALALDPGLAEAAANRDWVAGLAALAEQEYEDAGGTGGKLGADDVVFSDRAGKAKDTLTAEEAAVQGLTDAQIEEIWMRRVQTTPGDFLALKFAYQVQAEQSGELR